MLADENKDRGERDFSSAVCLSFKETPIDFLLTTYAYSSLARTYIDIGETEKCALRLYITRGFIPEEERKCEYWEAVSCLTLHEMVMQH